MNYMSDNLIAVKNHRYRPSLWSLMADCSTMAVDRSQEMHELYGYEVFKSMEDCVFLEEFVWVRVRDYSES